jgi:hypothetical protein
MANEGKQEGNCLAQIQNFLDLGGKVNNEHAMPMSSKERDNSTRKRNGLGGSETLRVEKLRSSQHIFINYFQHWNNAVTTSIHAGRWCSGE